jgi:hypothetical protein
LKKEPKNFCSYPLPLAAPWPATTKVFDFFFSKKEALAYVDNHDLIFIVTASAEIP